MSVSLSRIRKLRRRSSRASWFWMTSCAERKVYILTPDVRRRGPAPGRRPLSRVPGSTFRVARPVQRLAASVPARRRRPGGVGKGLEIIRVADGGGCRPGFGPAGALCGPLAFHLRDYFPAVKGPDGPRLVYTQTNRRRSNTLQPPECASSCGTGPCRPPHRDAQPPSPTSSLTPPS